METTEEIKELIENNNITSIPVHDCSICGYPCGYVINEHGVFYDSGCDCVSYSGLRVESFSAIADLYNMQSNPEWIDNILKGESK